MLIRSRSARILLVLLVTLLVLAFLSSQTNFAALADSFRAFEWLPWLAALLVFLLGHCLRYLRYALIWRWPRNRQSFAITGWHGVASYLLPMRLGELVLPALAKRLGGQGFIEVLFSLIWLRLLDLLLVAVLAGGFLLFSLWCRAEVIPSPWWPGGDALLLAQRLPITVLAVLALLVACLALRWILRCRLGLAASSSEQLRVLALSLLIWMSVLLMNMLLAYSLGVVLGLDLVIWLLLGATFAYAIPFQGVAGLGGHQLVWYAVLVAAALPATDAMALSISSHVLTVAWIVVLAVISALVSWRIGAPPR